MSVKHFYAFFAFFIFPGRTGGLFFTRGYLIFRLVGVGFVVGVGFIVGVGCGELLCPFIYCVSYNRL